jgi:hypothetical protein
MAEMKSSKSYRDRARAASAKPATAGEDIDLDTYLSSAEEQPYQADPSQLPARAKKQMLETGVILDDTNQRSGTFIQVDNAPVHCPGPLFQPARGHRGNGNKPGPGKT